MDFPSVGGLPWLFAEPNAALGEWRGRLHFSLQRQEREHAQLAAALTSKTLSAATRARLETLERGTRDHAVRLRALLAPLELEQHAASYETYLALRTRLPADQGLTTYYANIHRDWCWGDAENEASFDVLAALLGGASAGRVLVLGTGAGRLAYDLHMRTAASLTAALDFNPLLLLVAERVTRGETLELYEFPLAPRSDAALLRTLAAPAPARAGLVHVLADAHRPPFRRGAFDTVVTPWLIDILPERFDVLCARVNALLGDGGRWLNFGSLNFHDSDPALRYGLDECRSALAEHGFGELVIEEREIPYLSSPASRHARLERVVSWSARKQRDVKKVPRYHALPEWLVRGTDPVPLGDSFRSQAAATRIHAFLMSLIDGRRSIKDMAKLVVEQRLMSVEEAEPAIRSFLIKMHDDARRGSTY
ncbi:MAG TPA: class I SAM-dependent methyltransferase [Gammaproteobacteria bacterium]|nr:class I SAM-dependent methyltransferase [Gammaproteobacteria bacterium]